MSKRHYLMILIIILVSSGALTYGRSANKENVVSLKIDGSKKFQKVNRVVVNAYTSSWNGEELKPAINLLIDPMHTSIWSMIVETVYNCKYRNDNNNPFVFNLKYDNKRYETLKFKKDRDSTIYVKPEPKDWYTGDIHVHLNCGDGTTILPENKLAEMMKPNNLDVISVLADMGNGEVKDSKRDLPKVNGKDAPQSVPGRIIHWDTEWHWDATYSNFSNQALGGHLVLLGLNNAHQIWAESPYKILEWGRKQNAVTGFAHLEYMNDSVKNELNCCIPIDYPVEAALGTIDFVSEDVYGKTSPNNGNYFSEGAINAYYKLLNCGFRLGLAAGTDYPCNENEPLGTLLTYVQVDDKLTYQKWIAGIKAGRTLVSRNGHNEFLELKIDGKYKPGDDIKRKNKGGLSVAVKWTATKELTGRIEIVSNGKVITTLPGKAMPGQPLVFNTTAAFTKSGWICARRMDDQGHETHTAPIYITVNKKPVRASANDASFFIAWIDNLLENIKPGGKWNKYFPNDLATVKERYMKARNVYEKILNDCKNN